VSGRGSLFRAAAQRRDETGVDPVLLVVETKAADDLEEVAAASGIDAVRLDARDRTAFDAALLERLSAAAPDLVALTFDRILPPPTVQAFAGRIINVHPALLPAFVGTRAIARAIESGARIGGATIHEVIDAVDAGSIIAQAIVPILPDDDVASYGRRMYAQLEPMFLQVLRWYAEGRVRRDARGHLVIDGARYDALPIVPAPERFGAGT
jgi:folate-dependent phosphoribosylglycinamide formyltransferase PurN